MVSWAHERFGCLAVPGMWFVDGSGGPRASLRSGEPWWTGAVGTAGHEWNELVASRVTRPDDDCEPWRLRPLRSDLTGRPLPLPPQIFSAATDLAGMVTTAALSFKPRVHGDRHAGRFAL